MLSGSKTRSDRRRTRLRCGVDGGQLHVFFQARAGAAGRGSGRPDRDEGRGLGRVMRYTIDPISDNVFDAVTYESTKKGVKEVFPKTDEDWEKVKIGAVTLAEAIYLLKLPRPFAPAGDINNSTGPNPPELSPRRSRPRWTRTRCCGTRKSRRCGTSRSRSYRNCEEAGYKGALRGGRDARQGVRELPPGILVSGRPEGRRGRRTSESPDREEREQTVEKKEVVQAFRPAGQAPDR